MNQAFIKKENRDAAARALKERGVMVRKSSMRNQLMHPMHLADHEEVYGKLSQEDKGFGNTIYKTHFSVIYLLSSA